MLCIISDKTIKNIVTSELILKITYVEPLKKFLKVLRLRFGHIKQMNKERAAAMAMKITIKGKKRRRSYKHNG